MIQYFLSRLKIEGFRGINNKGDPLELKFKVNQVNSVFAVNASGKSSIFEALCYAIKGEIPKLSEMQASDRSSEYYVNRFHSGNVASIELDFTSSAIPTETVTVLVTRDSTGVREVTSPSGYANPEDLLSSLDEAFTLLDHASFTAFTDDTPLKRGRSFASLLGLSKYSNFRQSLQSLSDTRAVKGDLGVPALEATIESLGKTMPVLLTQAKTAYNDLLDKPLVNGSSLEDAATDVADALAGVSLIEKHFESKDLRAVDFDAVAKVLESAEGGGKRGRLQQIQQDLEQIEKLEPDSSVDLDADKLLSEVKGLESLLKNTQGDHYKHLMTAAQTIVENNELVDAYTCPVCGSKLETTVRSIIEVKLAQYSEVRTHLDGLKAKWRTNAFATLFNRIEQSPFIDLDEDRRKYPGLHASIQNGTITTTAFSEFQNHFQTLLQAVQKAKEKLLDERGEIEKDLPPSLVSLNRKIEASRRFKDAWVEHAEQQARYEESRAKLDKRLDWIRFINLASEAFAGAESRMISAKVSSISDDYKAMFADVMNTNAIVPELKRREKSEDLHLELTNFHGLPNLSAQALLSESFRNALAISVFLSAANRHKGKPRFIVLDDVTSSFDSGHQYFLMEYIRNHLQKRESSEGLQFIILSHDGQLEKYFDRLGGESGWHHQKLQGAPPVGAVVTLAQGVSRIENSAREFLNSGKVQQAEPLIRQHFEFKLTEIIRKVKISVPIDFAMKDQSRMVSGSINAIQDALDLHKAAGSLVLDSNQVADFTRHHVTGLISNWVSHYESAASTSLSANVLLRVLDDIDRLSECFQYEETKDGVTSRKWYRSLSSR